MVYLFSLWIALAAVLAAIALYRKYVSRDEDDTVHLNAAPDGVLQHQTEVAVKLDAIDKWGKTLTAVEVVFGLVLATVWLYQSWIENGKMN